MFKWQAQRENSMMDTEGLQLEVQNNSQEKVVKWTSTEKRQLKRKRSTMSDTSGRSRKIKVKSNL